MPAERVTVKFHQRTLHLLACQLRELPVNSTNVPCIYSRVSLELPLNSTNVHCIYSHVSLELPLATEAFVVVFVHKLHQTSIVVRGCNSNRQIRLLSCRKLLSSKMPPQIKLCLYLVCNKLNSIFSITNVLCVFLLLFCLFVHCVCVCVRECVRVRACVRARARVCVCAARVCVYIS